MKRRVPQVRDRCELFESQGDAALLAWRCAASELLRSLRRTECRLGIIETGVRAAEAPVRKRHVRIDAQRLIKGARGLDPHVPVQVVEPLSIESQSLAGRCGRCIE